MVKIKKDLKYLLGVFENYFDENKTRINKSLERATNALHHKKIDRIPVWQTSQTVLYPRHEIFSSPKKNLIMQLANIILTLEHETDYVPYLDPFEGVTILSEAFGCPVEVPHNGDPYIKSPLINVPRDVYNLKKPDKDNAVYKRVFDTLKFFEKETNYQIPVGATDPQGPLDIASLIFNNNDFLIACISNKREVHYLLSLITEAFIEFYTRQYELLKNPAFPVHSFPLVNSNDGIAVSDDESVLLSPELFEEFGVPYLNKISDAFGGLYYHSCGDFGHILDKILKIENLRAINGHLSPKEFKPEYIGKVLSKGVGLFLGISNKEIGWDDSSKWSCDRLLDTYRNYYIHNAIKESKGKGIVLVGYGSYHGYIDESIDNKGKDMVGISGHAIDEDCFANIPVERKNKNFNEIIKTIEDKKNELKVR